MLRTIYVIDADEAIRDSLAMLGDSHGFDVQCFESAEQFIAFVDRGNVPGGCILCEADLPGMSGLDLFTNLRARFFEAPFALLISNVSALLRRQASAIGVTRIVAKPLTNDDVMQFIEHAA